MLVYSHFVGGNADVVELDSKRQRVRLQPQIEDHGEWEAWWWCRIDDLTPERPVILEIAGGTPRGNGSWAWGRTAMREANGEWRLAPPGKIINEGGRSLLQHTAWVNGHSAEFAYAIPYTPQDATSCITDLGQNPEVEQFTLCHSKKANPDPDPDWMMSPSARYDVDDLLN